MNGYGYQPYFVEGDEPRSMHEKMAETLDKVAAEIRAIQEQARGSQSVGGPRWPMIILRTPKGWTGPKEVDGEKVEGTWRAHQVPMGNMDAAEHIKALEQWMKSYRPEELFDDSGALRPELQSLAPQGGRRMGANPVANGGLLLRDVMRLNMNSRNFRVFGPDETSSNRLDALFEVTDKTWLAETSSRRRAPIARGTGDGNLERAHLSGLARGLSPDWAAWAFFFLRGVYPHSRFHVQSARQMAENHEQ